jgi:hypothetical protein
MRRFFDFLVDGVSLQDECAARGCDEIGCLGWGGEALLAQDRARLQGEATGDFSDGRVSILVCAECGDLGCGAVSVRIRRDGQTIFWDDAGWQNDDEAGWRPIEGLGPYAFEFDAHKTAIETADLLERGP